VKDSRKDRLKTYRNMRAASASAGAAKPVPGKYDRLS
jgi:hypothetical protein